MSIDGTIRLPDAPASTDGVTGGLYDVVAAGGRPEPGRGLQVLAELSAATAVLDETPAILTQLGDDQVTELMGVLMRVHARAGQVATLAAADATDRGVVLASDAANTQQWVTGCATVAGVSVEARDAKTVTVIAQGCREARNRVVTAAMRDGACTLATARKVLEHTGKVAKILPTLAREDIQAWFIQLDPAWGSRGVDELTRALRARYEPDALDAEDAQLEAEETLSWRKLPAGMWRLTADLAPATATILKQAITALSAPQPATTDGTSVETVENKRGGKSEDLSGRHDTVTGSAGDGTTGRHRDANDDHPGSLGTTAGQRVRDERLPGKRRADALLELVGAGAKAAAGDGVGVGAAATLLVTLDLDALVAGVGVASTITGDVLDPGTARRLACDADLIPVVLGGPSQPLDVGRRERLVTKGMRAAVIFRDKGCTFPGCDRPPGFAEIHHLRPWWADGPTSLTNSALLCCRHHQVVHRNGYHGTVTARGVAWDLTQGVLPGRAHTGYHHTAS